MMETAEERDIHQMTLRLPTTLVERLKEIARQNRRSLRAEIEVALEAHVQSQNPEKPA